MGVRDLVARLPLLLISYKFKRLTFSYVRLSPLQRSKVAFHRVILVKFALDIIIDVDEFLYRSQVRHRRRNETPLESNGPSGE